MDSMYPEMMGGWIDVLKGVGKLAKKAGKGISKRRKKRKLKKIKSKSVARMKKRWKKDNEKRVRAGKSPRDYEIFAAHYRKEKKNRGKLLAVNAGRIEKGKSTFSSYSDYKKYKSKSKKRKAKKAAEKKIAVKKAMKASGKGSGFDMSTIMKFALPAVGLAAVLLK